MSESSSSSVLAMGLIGGLVGGALARSPTLVYFAFGTAAGVWAGQRYSLPPVTKELAKLKDKLSSWEQTNRKPSDEP